MCACAFDLFFFSDYLNYCYLYVTFRSPSRAFNQLETTIENLEEF